MGELLRATREGWDTDEGWVLIAAIARSQGLAVATPNLSNLDRMEVEVVNPWASPCVDLPKRLPVPPPLAIGC